MPTKKTKSTATKSPRVATPVRMSVEDAAKVIRAAKPASIKLAKPSAKPVTIKFLTTPKKFVKPKRVHPRRFPHRIVEGDESTAFSTTGPLALAMPEQAPAPMAATDSIKLVRNTELTKPTAQNTSSNVGEPSVAVNGNAVLYTGNWYAAVS